MSERNPSLFPRAGLFLDDMLSPKKLSLLLGKDVDVISEVNQQISDFDEVQAPDLTIKIFRTLTESGASNNKKMGAYLILSQIQSQIQNNEHFSVELITKQYLNALKEQVPGNLFPSSTEFLFLSGTIIAGFLAKKTQGYPKKEDDKISIVQELGRIAQYYTSSNTSLETLSKLSKFIEKIGKTMGVNNAGRYPRKPAKIDL